MSKSGFCSQKPQHLISSSWKSTRLFLQCCCQHVLLSPLFINIFYFVSLSFVGFGILKALDTRTVVRPRNIDLFFTSVSATTVSSMSTVEMEVFSNGQLIVVIVLMFIGGEVFTSMVGLLSGSSKVITLPERVKPVRSKPISPSPPSNHFDHIESSSVTISDSGSNRFESQRDVPPSSSPFTKYSSTKFLGFVVLGYLLVIHALGVSSILLYLACVQSAEDVLRNKGLKTSTFAIFTVVSTFTNCGFIPTNENMVVFRKNSGLLWILIPQILLGNTLFPPVLRVVVWVLGKRFRKTEARYLLQNSTEEGYYHLLPALHSVSLAATVFGFTLIGFTIFCSLEWNSVAVSGLTTYQKVAGIVFQCVNARHSGETIVDLSAIAPAILVFFLFMMYLPPYTLFLPIKRDEQSPILESEGRKNMIKGVAENLVFSPLTYLVIFIILICITERKSLKEDPIHFSVLNITFEVISAYGNVGFTTGYSCEHQLGLDPNCVNKLYGFSGKWSDKGKVILIIVMFFGRLKKFSRNGSQAWKFS